MRSGMGCIGLESKSTMPRFYKLAGHEMPLVLSLFGKPPNFECHHQPVDNLEDPNSDGRPQPSRRFFADNMINIIYIATYLLH